MTVTTPPERTFTVIAFQKGREIDIAAADRAFVVPDDD